jgi:hypothetical protein
MYYNLKSRYGMHGRHCGSCERRLQSLRWIWSYLRHQVWPMQISRRHQLMLASMFCRTLIAHPQGRKRRDTKEGFIASRWLFLLEWKRRSATSRNAHVALPDTLTNMAFLVICECMHFVGWIRRLKIALRQSIHGIVVEPDLARSLVQLPDEAFRQKLAEWVL